MSPNVVRIPKDRIAVLIGTDGKVRETVERRTGLKLDIDSETGDVDILPGEAGETEEGKPATGYSDYGDPVMPLKVADFVKAVGRGFAPEDAYRLLEADAYLDLIDLTEWVGDKENHLRRVKGRLIGRNGKTRTILQEYTGAALSIYGKTVAFIGDASELALAREAVEMLIDGAPHSVVYKHLDERVHELRLEKLGL